MNSEQPFIVDNSYCFKNTRVIDNNEAYHESVSIFDAIRMAREVNKDLVCFNKPSGKNLALCKVIDYGKWKYSQEKHEKEVSKEQRHKNKAMRFSPIISDHDIEHKIKHLEKFIKNGDSVVLTMRFDSRHAGKEIAKQKMDHIISLCSGFAQETYRKIEERVMRVRIENV